MSAITIENSSIKIPVEMVETDGLAIITIAPTVHLIVRASVLPHYPPELLQRLGDLAQSTQTPAPPAYHLYSPRKARALRELREKGYPVSGGEECFSNPVENPPSLEQVRRGLSSFKGSLADEIIAERDER